LKLPAIKIELPAGVLAGKEFISILIFCCDKTDKVNNSVTRIEVVRLIMLQSKEKTAE